MRGRWFLVAAVVLAIMGSVSLYTYLRGVDQRVPVVVAARDLSRRERIQSQDVRIAHLHPDALVQGAIRDVSQAVGRWVLREIIAGEQVTTGRTDVFLGSSSAYGLGLAYRAVFVPCSYGRALGGNISQGDRVDAIAVIASRSEPVAYRLATDLEVLEVRDDQGQRVDGAGRSGGFGGALLAVPDPLVEALALAISHGHVYLALRDPRPVIPEDISK